MQQKNKINSRLYVIEMKNKKYVEKFFSMFKTFIIIIALITLISCIFA